LRASETDAQHAVMFQIVLVEAAN